MAQQVKFYSTSSLPEKPNGGGVYFIDNGELYKGSKRFGLGRVTVDSAFVPSTSSKDGQARGDIVVTGSGAGWVFDGENWQSLGGDIASLQSMWQADIKTWTAGLVSEGQDDSTYIKQITKDKDGKVSAEVSNFATDVKDAVGNGFASGSSNGVIVSVTTTSGKVTSVEVTAPAEKTWTAVNVGDANSYIYNVTQNAQGQVSASAKAFPTLATGTASGTVKLGEGADVSVKGWNDLAASVGANTTAIEGLSTALESAEGRITGIESIVDVGNGGTVSASSGVFTNLNVTDTATFSVTNVSASSLTVNGSTIEEIADDRIAAIAASTVGSTATGITVNVTTQGGSVTAVSLNAESFTNVMHFLGVGTVTKTASGVNVSLPTGKTAVVGGIVIDKTSGLEAICTDTDPSVKWELIGDNAVYALNAYSSSANVYDSVTTVHGALNAVGAAADTFKAALDAKVTTASDVSAAGKASNLVTAGAVSGYVAQEIGKFGTAASKNFVNTLTATGTSLPTESAVAGYVSGIVEALDATPTDAGTQGVSVKVVEANGIITGVTTSVTKATLNTTLGTTNVADKTVATSIGATGVDTALATEKAVRDAITSAELVWLDASGAIIE